MKFDTQIDQMYMVPESKLDQNIPRGTQTHFEHWSELFVEISDRPSLPSNDPNCQFYLSLKFEANPVQNPTAQNPP